MAHRVLDHRLSLVSLDQRSGSREVEWPLASHALERGDLMQREAEGRAAREIDDAVGDQDLASLGVPADSLCDVNGEPSDLVASYLDLSDVHTGPDANCVESGVVLDRQG